MDDIYIVCDLTGVGVEPGRRAGAATHAQTIDFLLTAKRDTAAAKRFLRRAIDASGNPMPRVMNVDKNPAYPAAVEALKADGAILSRVVLRQCKYLNNVIEQDHRTVKKRVWMAKGYGSFQSAWRFQNKKEMQRANLSGIMRFFGTECRPSPDGRYLFLLQNNEGFSFPTFRVPLLYLDLKTGRYGEWAKVSQVSSLGFDPNRRVMALGHADSSVTLWDISRRAAETGRAIHTSQRPPPASIGQTAVATQPETTRRCAGRIRSQRRKHAAESRGRQTARTNQIRDVQYIEHLRRELQLQTLADFHYFG